MGHQHLSRALAASIALAATGCGAANDAAPPAVATARARHVQFVPALKSAERLALVSRLQERNGPEWRVDRDALLANGRPEATAVIDPYVGFLRRARSESQRPPTGAPVVEEAALQAARAFVRRNADLLGVPQSMVLALLASARPVALSDDASPRAAWIVRLEGTYPTRGYESFDELTNEIAIDLVIDDDGLASRFVNLSRVHPRLAIDRRPGLLENDWRVYEHVVGRRVFALAEDGHRIELGDIDRESLLEPKLSVQIVPGPLGAWMTYRLTWLVTASRLAPQGVGFYFFFYLVDTDTGEVVRDSPAPTQLVTELP